MKKKIPIPEYMPPYDERLVITKGDQSIALPYSYTLENSGDIKWRVSEDSKGFSHGGIAYGDRKVESRKIKISVHIRGDSEREYDRQFNELLVLFAGSDYLMTCGRADRAFKIESLVEVKTSFVKGYKQRWSDIEFTFLLTDPFRYAVNSTTINKAFATAQNEGKITFNNPSSVDVPLIISFAPPEGQTTPDIKIYHENTGQYFTLRDSLLTYPAVAVVNAETGTVRRRAANSLNTFVGIFLHAEPGQNTFLYTGGALNMTITFTARWLV